MKAERTFRRTVLLTMLAGHLAYAFAAEKPLLALIGIACALFSRWLTSQQLQGFPRPLPRALLNGLVIVAILQLAFQLLTRSQEVITSLTDFLAYVMLVKSLDRARMRDEAQLLGLSLFVVIGALLTGQSLLMGISLLAYTTLAIIAAVSLQFFTARERQRELLSAIGLGASINEFDAALDRSRSPRSVLRVAVFCALTSMTAGVVAFVITPRQLAQRLGMAAAPYLRTSTSTGFSDSITLGKRGAITEDDTPVMDVRITSDTPPPPGPIYLRGTTLNRYDSALGSWAPNTDENGVKPLPDIQRTSVLTIPDVQGVRSSTTYEIIVRNSPNASDHPLFAPYRPISVTSESSKAIKYFARDALLRMDTPRGRLVYSVTSSPDYIPAVAKDDDQSTASPPAVSQSLRIGQLARTLIEDRGIESAAFPTDPLQIRRAVQAISAHLSTFEYTLELSAPAEGQDALEYFLFERKAGHCEYFASAAAVMLQSIGIPARVVTGYAAGEFNNVTGFYTVRQSDAHAWLEVRLAPGRWETFDPTPPGNLQSARRSSSGPLAWMKQLWEAVEFSWLDNVVAYDKGIKLDGLGLSSSADAGAAAVRWQNRVRSIQDWFRRHLPEGVVTRSLIVGFVTFGLVLVVYGGAKFAARWFAPLRRFMARFMPGGSVHALGLHQVPSDATFYRDALVILAASGTPRPHAVTPADFARSLPAALREPLEAMIDLYYQSRYGDIRLTPQQQAQGQDALQQLARMLKRPRT